MTKVPAPRRAAAQQLASLRAAGVTRVSRSKPSQPEVPKPAIEQPIAPAGAVDSNATRSAASPGGSDGRLSFQSGRSNLPRADREERLKAIAARVAVCTRCQELASTRTQTVFGVGNPEAEIMFVGEAPGADEDRQGEPFVGAAGQLLNRILEASQLKRSDVYICNILRCRPPGNRNPLPDEAANCREYLDGQIEIVDPDYIVCLGSVAAKNLLGLTESIGKLRGRMLQYGRAKVVCTYHPAYLLRNPAAKKDVWEDMKFLMRDRGIDLSSK
jgi:DNA polymerase